MQTKINVRDAMWTGFKTCLLTMVIIDTFLLILLMVLLGMVVNR